MAKRRKNKKAQTDLKELVVVAYTEDIDQAKDYETLLKNNEIPILIKQQENPQGRRKNFAIMVPEDYVDEAHVIIESQDAYDDFYDFALDEKDEFGSEPLDEDF